MKKKFVLRIDEEVYDALEKWAADEFRSVNGQIEWILAQQLKAQGRMKKKPGPPPLTDPKDSEAK